MTVRVEVRSETGTSRDPAKVRIYENDNLVSEVTAKIEPEQGADGGWYHCVTLEKQEQKDRKTLFQIVLGQDGDDYVGGSAEDLIKAMEIANNFAKKVNGRPIASNTTYIYVLTPAGDRINVPYQTISK